MKISRGFIVLGVLKEGSNTQFASSIILNHNNVHLVLRLAQKCFKTIALSHFIQS
jgi:hypothetical protein